MRSLGEGNDKYFEDAVAGVDLKCWLVRRDIHADARVDRPHGEDG